MYRGVLIPGSWNIEGLHYRKDAFAKGKVSKKHSHDVLQYVFLFVVN